jgi:cytochrome c5
MARRPQPIRNALWLALCWSVPAWPQAKLPDGPGKATFEAVCGACHSPGYVLGRKGTALSWQNTIGKMIARGAEATPEQWDQVKAYLAQNFSYAPGEFRLPEGAGKDAVERVCTGCHSAEVFIGSEGTTTHWNYVVDRMLARGARATDREFDQITAYLARNFAYIPTPSNLPEGPEKYTVEKVCGPCHGVALLNGRQGTANSWSGTIDNMIGRGAAGTPEEYRQILDYLVRNFGVSSK